MSRQCPGKWPWSCQECPSHLKPGCTSFQSSMNAIDDAHRILASERLSSDGMKAFNILWDELKKYDIREGKSKEGFIYCATYQGWMNENGFCNQDSSMKQER